MTTDPVEALGLPPRAIVRERLTKKLLLDMAAETAGDRKLLSNAVAGASVEAVLTPATTGIAECRDSSRRVQDVAVISVALSGPISTKDRTRLLDLLHRSMPRPVVLLLREPDAADTISVALTRVSRTDDSRSVVDATVTSETSALAADALSLRVLNRTDLWAYYQDLARAVATNGSGGGAGLDAKHAIDARHQLDALDAELGAVTRQAQKENSLQKRIDLNTRAKALRAEIQDLRGLLYAAR